MDIRGSKIAVLGGAGLIGSHLVEALTREDVAEILVFDNFMRGRRESLAQAERDPRVKVVEGDFRRPELVRSVLAGKDLAFLLGASWLLECVEHPRQAVENNILGTYNVLEGCRDAKIRRLVFSSSASVYGNALSVPMTEEHPFNNRTLYGATKIAGEQLCRAFAEMYKLNYVGLRYMNVYGPRQDYRGAYVAVIMKILDRIDQGLAPLVYGDGSQSYDFVYVEDVAQANLCALKADVTDEFFNVGTGVRTTILEITETLLELTKCGLRPQFAPEGQTFVTHRIGSTEKAERLLGFKATTPLREGLARLIEWRRGAIARETAPAGVAGAAAGAGRG